MRKTWHYFEKGEITTIITIGTLVFLGISTLASSFLLKNNQTSSAKATATCSAGTLVGSASSNPKYYKCAAGCGLTDSGICLKYEHNSQDSNCSLCTNISKPKTTTFEEGCLNDTVEVNKCSGSYRCMKTPNYSYVHLVYDPTCLSPTSVSKSVTPTSSTGHATNHTGGVTQIPTKKLVSPTNHTDTAVAPKSNISQVIIPTKKPINPNDSRISITQIPTKKIVNQNSNYGSNTTPTKKPPKPTVTLVSSQTIMSSQTTISSRMTMDCKICPDGKLVAPYNQVVKIYKKDSVIIKCCKTNN